MKGLQIFVILILPFITSGQVTDFLKSSGSVIRANSQTADIFIDGKLVGQGEVSGVKIKRDECITVQVSEVGYITQIKEFCRKKVCLLWKKQNISLCLLMTHLRLVKEMTMQIMILL